MLLNFKKDNLLRDKFIWMIISYAIFGVAYLSANANSVSRDFVAAYPMDWEVNIPFIGWMVLPYMTSWMYFIAIFFLCKDKDSLMTITKRINFMTIVACIIYFIKPLQFIYDKPPIENPLFAFIFNWLDNGDNGFNQAPSLHISYAIIFWTTINYEMKNKGKYLLNIIIILMSIATLTIYQHHFIDIIGGFLLGITTFYLFPRGGKLKSNSKVSLFYYLIGTICLTLGTMRPTINWFFIWLFVILYLIAMCYGTNYIPRFIKKEGKLNILVKLIFFPYFLGYYLNWYLSKRGDKFVMVLPNLFIGARPTSKSAKKIAQGKSLVTIDLGLELDEIKELRNNNRYCNFPTLDLSEASDETFNELLNKSLLIYNSLEQEETLYIHCTMGYLRSTTLVIAMLKKIRGCSTEEAISFLKGKYNDIKLKEYSYGQLKRI